MMIMMRRKSMMKTYGGCSNVRSRDPVESGAAPYGFSFFISSSITNTNTITITTHKYKYNTQIQIQYTNTNTTHNIQIPTDMDWMTDVISFLALRL